MLKPLFFIKNMMNEACKSLFALYFESIRECKEQIAGLQQQNDRWKADQFHDAWGIALLQQSNDFYCKWDNALRLQLKQEHERLLERIDRDNWHYNERSSNVNQENWQLVQTQSQSRSLNGAIDLEVLTRIAAFHGGLDIGQFTFDSET